MKAIPDIIKETARNLRQNMTEVEKRLWKKIRAKKVLWKKFWRQSPLYVYTENSWLDRYVIPDFVCFEEKLIIELDWNVHNVSEVYLLDRYKEKLLQNLWFRIIRFKNENILNELDLVLEKISTLCSWKE